MLWKPPVLWAGAANVSSMHKCSLLNSHADFWQHRTSSMLSFTREMDTTSFPYTTPLLCTFLWQSCDVTYSFRMFYAIAPSEFESGQLVVDVETEGTITSGTMVNMTLSNLTGWG